MAPLTLIDKYDDLVRAASQPTSAYQRLNTKDLEDVISKTWPFIIESVTYTPSVDPMVSDGECRTRMERRLKLRFSLYADVAKKYQLKFPNRMPIPRKRHSDPSLHLHTHRTISSSFVTAVDLPDFYVLCPPEQVSSTMTTQDRKRHQDRLRKYLSKTTDISPLQMRVFQQAIQVLPSH